MEVVAGIAAMLSLGLIIPITGVRFFCVFYPIICESWVFVVWLVATDTILSLFEH